MVTDRPILPLDFRNVGCAKGISAVHEFVLLNAQFVFREQTCIHVSGTIFAIAKFAL